MRDGRHLVHVRQVVALEPDRLCVDADNFALALANRLASFERKAFSRTRVGLSRIPRRELP
jgi:hypothetical protein